MRLSIAQRYYISTLSACITFTPSMSNTIILKLIIVSSSYLSIMKKNDRLCEFIVTTIATKRLALILTKFFTVFSVGKITVDFVNMGTIALTHSKWRPFQYLKDGRLCLSRLIIFLNQSLETKAGKICTISIFLVFFILL